MLDKFLLGSMLIISILFLLAIVRAIRGPRFTDRIVAINMIGTMTVIFTCILSVYLDEAYLVDIAIVYTMLSFLGVMVLSRVVILHHKGRLLHMSEEEKKKYE